MFCQLFLYNFCKFFIVSLSPLHCCILFPLPVSHLSSLIVLDFVLSALSFPQSFLYFPLESVIFYLLDFFHADFLVVFLLLLYLFIVFLLTGLSLLKISSRFDLHKILFMLLKLYDPSCTSRNLEFLRK